MASLRARLIAQLARIDQEIAEACSIGNDISLEMNDIFKMCEVFNGLQLARSKVEAMLNGEAAEIEDPSTEAGDETAGGAEEGAGAG